LFSTIAILHSSDGASVERSNGAVKCGDDLGVRPDRIIARLDELPG
jgi:hypothetical protein